MKRLVKHKNLKYVWNSDLFEERVLLASIKDLYGYHFEFWFSKVSRV